MKKEKSDKMQRSLTSGPITKGILLFALPLMLGNLLQQMYNIADTWVVGRFLGTDALAAVGSSYTLSESACLRSFRQLLGTTPIQYVKQYRIEKAAELLLSTSMKTGEVGVECGFADTSYFTKTFREMKNCTPKEYRRRFAREE